MGFSERTTEGEVSQEDVCGRTKISFLTLVFNTLPPNMVHACNKTDIETELNFLGRSTGL